MKVSIQQISAFVLATIPIAGVYKIGVIPLDMLLMLIVVIFSFFTKKNKFHLKLFSFFIFFAILNFFAVLNSAMSLAEIFFNNTIYFLSYSLLFCLVLKHTDQIFFYKIIYFFAIISTTIIFVQYLSYNFFNTSLDFFLPLDMNVSNNQGIDFQSSIFVTGRPNSLFLEPAHYAIFTLPVFYYTLLKNRILLAVFFMAGIMLSTSTTGFAIGLILLFYNYLIKSFNLKSILIVFISGFLYIISYNFIINIVSRNIVKLSSDSLSENIRIFGTTNIVNYIIDNHLFFGIGFNQLSAVLNELNYANTYFNIFFSFGIFGVILFLVMLGYLFKINSQKGFWIILVLICATDQIFVNRNFLYLLSIIYLLNIRINEKKTYILPSSRFY